jgi:hypothetical protein
VTWDVYAVARLARRLRASGDPIPDYQAQRQRRLYAFRNRHGFTDAADAAFDRLWRADGLTWPDLLAISAGAVSDGGGSAVEAATSA